MSSLQASWNPARLLRRAEMAQSISPPQARPVSEPAAAIPLSAPKIGGAPAPQRDRYIDSLRVLALIRVVTYHLFGWIWLPIAFPSMGVMFALAGSLMAASLDRETRHYTHVIVHRVRRLLPPLWVLGLVLVPVMIAMGWRVSGDLGMALSWQTLWLWLVPLSTPPSSGAGHDWVLPLWYIATYLWLVFLSPPLLWLFRRWPKRMLTIPLVLVALVAAGLLQMWGPIGDIALYVCTYASCWMLGFAHHDGLLRRIPLRRIAPVAGALIGFGLIWAYLYPDIDAGANVSDIPLAAACFNLGVVMVLLRLYLDFSWMSRLPLLDHIVSAINRRALTIYLWGNVAIFVAAQLVHRWPPTARYADGPDGPGLWFAATWLVLGVCVLLFGWVEDLAARRKPSLLGGRR